MPATRRTRPRGAPRPPRGRGSLPGRITGPAPGSVPGPLLVLALAPAAMVVSVMQTVVVPILPVIRNELSLSSSAASWLITATLLSAAVSTPLLGRLGDQHGKRPVLLGVLALTTAGSVLAATAGSLPLLITARVLQGSSTALFPLALAVLRDEVRPDRLPGAMGLVSGTLAFGSGSALVGAGLLTRGPEAGYDRVFWLATALSAVALAAVALAVPPSPEPAGGRTDWAGAALLATALVLFLLPVSQGNTWGWDSPRVLGCLAGAAVATSVWVLVERRVREPMVDLRMFLLRPVLFTNIAGVLLGFGLFTQFIGVSYLVQTPPDIAGYGFGASVLRASVVYLLPGATASLAAARLGGVLAHRLGPRITLAAGAGAGVAGFAVLALAHGTPAAVVTGGVLTGIAVAFGFATLPAFIVAGVPAHQSGIAGGLNSISRSVGSSVASAVITALLAAGTLPDLPPGAPALPAESQYTLSFALGGAAFALVVLVALAGLNLDRPRARVVLETGPAADRQAEGRQAEEPSADGPPGGSGGAVLPGAGAGALSRE
ncbi:MFS transporter [Streptomyces sp. F63]|uniref:MFS transporter n=1 Tax=Streptomyces sp. F63 TaxID=2824887 RepID=UPI001B3787FA|nr:MFS transporter [Streptomyces sp. F63]MBQ0984095.1 MFS transporter [Streptomyces sp. F63]